MARISIASSIRAFLDECDAHTIEVHWCPSHRGFALNEFVDEEAKAALSLEHPDSVSYSWARSRITAKALRKWRQSMRDTTYRGRHCLLPKKVWDKLSHSAATHPILKEAGADTRLMARVSRLVSGHAPIGEFRMRFEHIPGPVVRPGLHPALHNVCVQHGHDRAQLTFRSSSGRDQ
ncbi:hypothetical protein K474DRAFT_1707713 [Panus rudis PR-1116 ss-1]|nr:hypothetical protein K474DRAFT_1707713 [Panus rudis PR-1116 ss-1]